MVYVPAGEFAMGTTEADVEVLVAQCVGDGNEEWQCQEWLSHESPQHTVYVDGFWIDRTEVTNARYRQCVEDGACLEPRCSDDGDVNAPDQPVVCVSWEDARAYVAWVGGRLPTEAEWERAARGSDGRIYPWGNGFDAQKANYCDRNCPLDWRDLDQDDGYAWSAPVGSFSAGASPYGLMDMAGNAWEWVADWYGADYYAQSPARNPQGPESGHWPLLRGGSFLNVAWSVRSAMRHRSYPQDRIGYYGFRVAMTADLRGPGY
jgi:formylglycine-generating enzyme required for sulfatase activity